MSTVTITLENKKASPWGYFRKVLVRGHWKSLPIIWLTEDKPVQEIDSDLLSEAEIHQIQMAATREIISVKGIDIPEGDPIIPCVVNNHAVRMRLLDEQRERDRALRDQMIIDVSTLMLEEDRQVEEIKAERSVSVYPHIEEFMNRPAPKVKKDIKEMMKSSPSVSFFSECLKFEEENKCRKTICLMLRDILQAQAVLAERSGDVTALTEVYARMIEESFDEDSED